MIKFYSASYDASIYLQLPKQNTGIDGILEVGKFYTGTTKEIYRTLIKFPTNDISSSISSNEITGSWKAFLNLKSANTKVCFLLYDVPTRYFQHKENFNNK